MKKRIIICLVLIIFIVLPKSIVINASATEKTNEPAIKNEDLLEEIDLSALEEYFNSLTEEQKDVFGGDVKTFLKNTINGEFGNFEKFFSYVTAVTGKSVVSVLPLLLTVVAVGIMSSLIGGIKSKFASKSVEDVINFASIISVAVVTLISAFALIKDVSQYLNKTKMQMEIIFPLLFTLMSALGASGSIAVYQPAVAILTFGITNIISSLILPMLIITLVLAIVGNLSSSIKLNGTSKFFASSTKWVLGTAFFLFLGFLSVKGVTASVYDNMSVRTAKFALSKYIPIIGGYLSEGFNLVLAGTVLVKNAIGSTAVIITFVSMLPVLIQTIIFTLALKLASALIEPFSCDRINGVINGVSSTTSILSAVILGSFFSYFVFLMLLICSANLVL